MSRLDRYVLKEIMVPMFVGTVVIALLFMANEFIAVFKNFEVTRLPMIAILQMVFYRMPEWLSLTLPSGTAIGVALAVSRLGRESEITAMRAAGIPVRRIIMPIVLVGVVVSIANFIIVEKLIPPAAKRYKSLTNQASVLGSAPAFKSNVMLQLDRYTVNFGNIQRTGEGEVQLNDIVIFERPKAGEIVLYIAETGEYKDGVWTINAPQVYFMRGNDLTAVSSAQNATINERITVGDLFVQPAPQEETAVNLWKKIKEGRASKLDMTPLEIAYHVKYALPASCLVFAFAAAAFAVLLSRSGPFTGLIVSMVLVMLFYNFYVISTEIIGKNGWLPPLAAAWLPNTVYFVIGAIILRRIE